MKDPTKRIGFIDTAEIKTHKWFENVNWDDVDGLKLDPPIKPLIEDKFDVSNFNKNVQKEGILMSD